MQNNPIPNLLDHIFPIGSIYMNVNSIDPNVVLGGSWERIYNKFLLGGGDDYEIGSTGGEETHTLSQEEMPSHNHWSGYGFFMTDWTNAEIKNRACISSDRYYEDGHSGNTTSYEGGGAPHNNMPPYLSICIWKRIA